MGESSISISISKSSRRFDHRTPHSRGGLGRTIASVRDIAECRDLKNCILYSITKLSRRLVSFYNSKRIHAATRAPPLDRSGSLSRSRQRRECTAGVPPPARSSKLTDIVRFQKFRRPTFVSDFVDWVRPPSGILTMSNRFWNYLALVKWV